MPWCPACARFLTQSTTQSDGTCPFCKQVVDYSRNAMFSSATERGEELAPEIAMPWHLKLLLGAGAIYLGWRFLQGVEWVTNLF